MSRGRPLAAERVAAHVQANSRLASSHEMQMVKTVIMRRLYAARRRPL
jgi:hypothetical protein